MQRINAAPHDRSIGPTLRGQLQGWEIKHVQVSDSSTVHIAVGHSLWNAISCNANVRARNGYAACASFHRIANGSNRHTCATDCYRCAADGVPYAAHGLQRAVFDSSDGERLLAHH